MIYQLPKILEMLLIYEHKGIAEPMIVEDLLPKWQHYLYLAAERRRTTQEPISDISRHIFGDIAQHIESLEDLCRVLPCGDASDAGKLVAKTAIRLAILLRDALDEFQVKYEIGSIEDTYILFYCRVLEELIPMCDDIIKS